ncbi:MAG TPA: sensor histidine kinase [Anaerolineales bacterium]|nr:sensor histidine kinase [Anaerolineales bacterium]
MDAEMTPDPLSSPSFQQQWRTLLIFMVVVGYIATFATGAGGGVQYSAGQLVVGILLGIVYLILGMFDAELLGRFSEQIQNILFFTIQCLLVLGIGMLLGPGGNWLIGLPLVGFAVERLSPRSRWVIYIAVILAIILPIAYYSTLGTAFMNAVIMSTAIFFVVLFTQLRLNEQSARVKAEELAHQLEVANHQLAEYASQAEELAATQERNRLAREIHDNLGHYLTIVNVQIEAAKVTCETDPARALDALDKAHDLAKKGLTSVRESVAALRVSPVENRRIEDAITELIEESQTTGIETSFKIIGESKLVEPKSALALYRVVQEGLTNVRKHADASHVDVTLDFSQPDVIRLTLRDNGSGATDTSGGFGLIGLRERVQLLGGEFKIETQPGQGFAIGVTLLLAEETAE